MIRDKPKVNNVNGSDDHCLDIHGFNSNVENDGGAEAYSWKIEEP